MSLRATVTVVGQEEDTPVRGNACASGDLEFDKKVEDEILARLYSGDQWAWAYVVVRMSVASSLGDTLELEEALGCCTYESEAAFRADQYFADMVSTLKARFEAFGMKIEGTP